MKIKLIKYEIKIFDINIPFSLILLGNLYNIRATIQQIRAFNKLIKMNEKY